MAMTASFRKNEILFGTVYGLFQFMLLPSLAQYINQFLQLPIWALQFTIFVVNFVCTVVIFWHYLLDSCKAALENIGKVALYTFLGLVLYYTANLVVSYIIFSIAPDYLNLNDAGVTALAQQSGIWIALGTVLLVPVVEECLFRGLLFRGIYDRSPFLAWCLSASLFSAIHVLSYASAYDSHTLLAFLQYLPAGICLCFGYRASGTIITPILMHAIINIISLCVLM